MGVIDELKRECAGDLWRAGQRLECVNVLAYAEAHLRGLGYPASVVRQPGGMVALRVDPDYPVEPGEPVEGPFCGGRGDG